MDEVMTIPMRVTEDSENLPMTLDMQMVVGGGAVYSVNGQTGDVVLTASDVGALPDDTVIPTKTSQLDNDSGFLTSIPSEYVTGSELQTAISGKANTADLATVATSGDYDDLLDKPTIPTKTSDLENDSGFITSVPVQSVNSKTGAVVLDASDVGAIAQETDPTVPSWAKQANKPTYTASEVGALPDTTTIPTKVSQLQNDSGFLSTAVTSFNGSTGAVTYTAPVSSVNSQTGAVVLTASDVGALPSSYTAPVSSVNGQTGAVVISNATTSNAGLMSAQDKTDLGTLMADYSSALTALGVSNA